MNPAARLVIVILGALAIITVLTICLVAYRTGEVTIAKDISLLVIGAISGVLAKVGHDAASDALTTDESGKPAVNTVESGK